MSYRRLDTNNKPLPRKGQGRTSREPATKKIGGKDHYHYEITYIVSAGDGNRRYAKRHFWLLNDDEAERKQRELKFQAPAEALTWRDAAAVFMKSRKLSPSHQKAISITIDKWCASLGAGSTLEGTSLAAFCSWLEMRRKGNTGRAAQLDFSHLMAIARWCRQRGMVKELPFIDAPKPEAVSKKRKPAGVEQFHDMLEVLPEAMRFVWRMLGLTGMRLSAACTLLESRIEGKTFTVITKGDRSVSYPITPAIAALIRDAKAWKAEKGFSTGYLFCNAHGAAWNNQSYGQQLRKVCERLEIPRVTAHQLRHLAGTAMAQQNLSADIIQAGLGHRSRKSAEVYIDQTQKMRDRALKAVDKIISKTHDNNLTTIDTKNTDMGNLGQSPTPSQARQRKRITCPRCGHKHSIDI